MKRRLKLILAGFIFLLGLGIFLYPTISSAWNKNREKHLITEYNNVVREADNHVLNEEWEKAQAYNQTLNGTDIDMMLRRYDGITDLEYESLLNLSGDSIMGSVEIPTIDVDLPIYHYTTDEVLEKGAGHLAGTSLPVGGIGTHAVLSAHRGLPSARLFTDLDKLDEGDVFYIHVLDRELAYEVDQIKTIEPDELSDLAINKKEDYVTLLTCTPYGVNTDRLLVRGHRIEIEKADEIVQNEPKKAVVMHDPNLFMTMVCIGVGAIAGLAVIGIIRVVNKKKRGK